MDLKCVGKTWKTYQNDPNKCTTTLKLFYNGFLDNFICRLKTTIGLGCPGINEVKGLLTVDTEASHSRTELGI